MNKKNNRKGFTIVELVIVIAVIAILATVLVPTFGDVINKANESKALQAGKNAYSLYVANVDYAAGDTAAETVYYVSGDYTVKIVNGAAEIVNALPASGTCYTQITDAGAASVVANGCTTATGHGHA